jgi:hypothetical protein
LPEGQEITFRLAGARHEVLLPLPGRFQADNALLALMLAITTSAYVFGQDSLPLLFLPTLPMILIAFRVGRGGVAMSIAMLALIGGLALTAWNHARYTPDAAMLLRENRDEIDFQRLQKAVRSLELTADYDAIWRDAFPDEPMPQSGG